MQWQRAKGISHCVVGASGGGDVRFYGGRALVEKEAKKGIPQEEREDLEEKEPESVFSWYDETESKFGFLVVEITPDAMVICFFVSFCPASRYRFPFAVWQVTRFIDSTSGKTMKKVVQASR